MITFGYLAIQKCWQGILQYMSVKQKIHFNSSKMSRHLKGRLLSQRLICILAFPDLKGIIPNRFLPQLGNQPAHHKQTMAWSTDCKARQPLLRTDIVFCKFSLKGHSSSLSHCIIWKKRTRAQLACLGWYRPLLTFPLRVCTIYFDLREHGTECHLQVPNLTTCHKFQSLISHIWPSSFCILPTILYVVLMCVDWWYHGNLRGPPQCHPPPRNKALLRDY